MDVADDATVVAPVGGEEGAVDVTPAERLQVGELSPDPEEPAQLGAGPR